MTAIDTTRDSLTLIKNFQYRGNDEEWSNTYFMDGDTPSSPSSWKTLADNVAAEEKSLYPSTTEVYRAIGHVAGESVAVWTWDYEGDGHPIPGTFAVGSLSPQSGDTAAWLRWSTDALTSKGKPIFLRSYYHPAFVVASGDYDTIGSGWVTAAEAFGLAWVNGFLDGDTVEHHRAGPHGVAGLVAHASTFATTRTLERRGKRPPA